MTQNEYLLLSECGWYFCVW